MKLASRIILITGGTGAFGSTFAEAVAGEGAEVYIAGRNEDRGNELVEKLRRQHYSANFIKMDVTSPESIKLAAIKLQNEVGHLDGLVNAAGGILSSGILQPNQELFDLDINGVKENFDLNCWGTLQPIIALGPLLLKSKYRASVVNISSSNANQAVTRVLGYNIAKAGIDYLTQWLAVEMSTRYGEKIRVNAIKPGFFITEQNYKLLVTSSGEYSERANKILYKTPFKRFGKPEELNQALIWLLSEGSSFAQGSIVTIDGGFSSYAGV